MPKRVLGIFHLIKLFNSSKTTKSYDAHKYLDPRFRRTPYKFGFVGPSVGLSFCDKFSKELKDECGREHFFFFYENRDFFKIKQKKTLNCQGSWVLKILE